MADAGAFHFGYLRHGASSRPRGLDAPVGIKYDEPFEDSSLRREPFGHNPPGKPFLLRLVIHCWTHRQTCISHKPIFACPLPSPTQEHQKNVLVDLYANRGVAAASAGRASPAHSMRLNRDVSSESLAARKLAHRLRGLPPQPLALDHLRATIPHPTPVRPQEDSRMNLLTLNPREFFKYRYEKPISGVAPGSRIEPSEQLQTPVSTTGTVIDSSIPQVGDGFSGIIWVHLLAGRGLRATTTTSSTTGGPSSAVSEPGVNRDLYCVIECDRVHKARTVVRNGESSFDWDEVFELDLIDSKEVSFLLYTWDPQYRHKLCYKGIVNLISLSLSETPVHSLALKMEPRGTLYIKMRYKEPSSTFQRPLPSPPLPSALFGVDVETVVVREASGSSVPLIIKRCVEEIEKRGLELVGIYRLCGSAMRKKMLRDAFEKNAWLVDLSAEHVPDINVITSECIISLITILFSEFYIPSHRNRCLCAMRILFGVAREAFVRSRAICPVNSPQSWR